MNLENPPEETPGWHASELETSQMLARDVVDGTNYVRMDRAEKTLAQVLELRPNYADDPRAPFRARGMPVELIESLMEGLRKAGLEVKPAE